MTPPPPLNEQPLLHVYFWLPRDPARYEGLASDRIYGEGVEFMTLRELSLRQMIRISLAVQPPGGEVGNPTPPVPAEITHIEEAQKGWRVYATFLDLQAAVDIPAEDRRAQPRYPAHLRAEYTLVDGMPPHPCMVEDISRSGASFEADQGLRIGRHITLRVFSGDKQNARLFLESLVEIRRSRHKGEGIYEIGVTFLHRRNHPEEESRPTPSLYAPPPGTPGASPQDAPPVDTPPPAQVDPAEKDRAP